LAEIGLAPQRWSFVGDVPIAANVYIRPRHEPRPCAQSVESEDRALIICCSKSSG